MDYIKILEIIKGKVIKFQIPENSEEKYKIPQIGWNGLLKPNNKTDWNHSILNGIMENTYMYFFYILIM